MMKEKYWYSTLYQDKDCGFSISKLDKTHFLNYKAENGKEISIPINIRTFKVLKKEWR